MEGALLLLSGQQSIHFLRTFHELSKKVSIAALRFPPGFPLVHQVSDHIFYIPCEVWIGYALPSLIDDISYVGIASMVASEY